MICEPLEDSTHEDLKGQSYEPIPGDQEETEGLNVAGHGK